MAVLSLGACSNGADAQLACDRWRDDYESAADAWEDAVQNYLATHDYDRLALEFPGESANEATERIYSATASYADRVEGVEDRQPEDCPKPDTWLDTGDVPR